MPTAVRLRRRPATREPQSRAATPAAAAPTQLQTIASAVGNAAFARYSASTGDVRLAEHRDEVLARLTLDFERAKRKNRHYASRPTVDEPAALGWGERLDAIAGGGLLASLWKAGRFDEFARAVAEIQIDLGFRERDVDGVLGPATWSRLAGYGEAMAAIDKTVLEKSAKLCYAATEERMQRGHRLATGAPMTLPEGATWAQFERIIASMPERMGTVDERHRGTGAAGALVYAGLGDFVREADIWVGGLRPGATIQVFRHPEAFDLLHRAGDKTRDRLWQALGDDRFFYGTSYVFVRYDSETPERMLVRHFGRLEWVSRADWAVWVAANPRTPARP
jgi:hypothetical protein